MKRMILNLACLALYGVACVGAFTTAAEAKSVLVVRGIFGNVVAPMEDITNGLRKKGHKVTVAEWFAIPSGKYDVAIGHSAGDKVLHTKAKRIITIDPTFMNPGCPRGATCTNYYAPINKWPFIVCCGGYAVRGATNIKVPGTLSFIVVSPGHVAAPAYAAPRIIAGI